MASTTPEPARQQPVRQQPVRQPGLAGSIPLMIAVVALLLAGLPVAVWLDLRSLSERALQRQATALDAAITSIRNFYSHDVVARVKAGPLPVPVLPDYLAVPGAIPIPATLSLRLGNVITSKDGGLAYRFFSDIPFGGRPPHPFDGFEREALARLRRDPRAPVSEVSGTILDRRIRLVTPILMGAECLGCHNADDKSPKHDWKIGDVRGLQEVELDQPLAANILAFKYLLAYLAAGAAIGVAFIALQRRQARTIARMNRELGRANAFLGSVSDKLARYLSPQLYRSIFSGQKDVVIATERKKLTIFFSDIVDFTATTERLQPEELARLLNEYLTEMSAIAQRHGGTVDKFVGDAILVFFGDPESRGEAADARACLEMAIEQQQRLAELDLEWRRRGIDRPFRARMGINTGFCNVGNFGSSERMAYTIIGGEANLAARLQAIAEPGGIVLSQETYALVRDLVRARPLPPIAVKGIGRPVVPYVVDGLLGELGQRRQVVTAQATGLELFLDAAAIEAAAIEPAQAALRAALAALEARRAQAAG
ncbi:MAG: adenylate/guanylate cyclase domain-containing protein [Dongiaceae bacterium]